MSTSWVPKERTLEQTDDGAFRRQANRFPARFGDRPGQIPVESGRFRLVVSPGCAWSRRQLIVRRLLGLQDALPVSYVTRRTEHGWVFGQDESDVDPALGVHQLDDLYEATPRGLAGGRGTVPVVIDTRTGQVATNDYHTLSVDLETAWRPLHAPGAPDLYPAELRPQIDLLNQQLFDDINNGPYKVLFARSTAAATAAKLVWEARLADLDHRLATRRYLFGERLTDSDVRLFVTLAAFDTKYRPDFPADLGPTATITDFPHLWAYARDLFATEGFIDEREKIALGLASDGTAPARTGLFGDGHLVVSDDAAAPWAAPHGREGLTGSPWTAGPGGAGSDTLWRWG